MRLAVVLALLASVATASDVHEARMLLASKNLKDRLAAIEMLAGVDSRAAIQAQLDKAKSGIDAQRQKTKETKAKLDGRIEELKADSAAKIEEWKTNRELKKLDHRAERAEDYAAWSIDVAVSAVAEAELATLEAIDARLLSDEASTDH